MTAEGAAMRFAVSFTLMAVLTACGSDQSSPPRGAGSMSMAGAAQAGSGSSSLPAAGGPDQALNAGGSGASSALPGAPGLGGTGGDPSSAGFAGVGSDGGSAGLGAAGNAANAGNTGSAGSSGSGGATGAVVLSAATDGKQTINGPYNAPPEATRKNGVPVAVLDHFVYDTSKVFPNTSRNVDIFIPAQYVPGTPVPFMVIQDGDEQLASFKTNIVLENLIDQKRLPVMAAIFVNRADNGPVRSLEYDCLDEDYSNFILNELIPLVKTRQPRLKLTDDPNGRGALGKSSGGPASFTLGWRHPEAFRRILTMNGSFVNLCKDGPGANTYPDSIRKTEPAKPLRIYLFSGDGDNGGFAAGNQAMADAFTAKGYTWRYVFGIGSNHGNNFGASLMTEALLWTWAGYPLDGPASR